MGLAMVRRAGLAGAVLAGACALCLGGCLKRTIAVTTEPPGALVWLNDVEVGRTPLETDFTFYGTYDVRIRREGYEPISTSAKARPPVQELPGIDLAAEALPVQLHNVVRWHWTLTPLAENVNKADAEASLKARAQELRLSATNRQPAPEPAQAAAPTNPAEAEGQP
jgi:PEGA domain